VDPLGKTDGSHPGQDRVGWCEISHYSERYQLKTPELFLEFRFSYCQTEADRNTESESTEGGTSLVRTPILEGGQGKNLMSCWAASEAKDIEHQRLLYRTILLWSK
jgi:hypothetical protein